MNLSEEDREKLREGMPKIEQGIIKNIIKAVTEGKIPTDRQLEMLKSAVSMNEQSTPPQPDAPDFQLDVAVPDDRKGMADFYAVEPITITRWKNAGREAKDPCPLKTPAQIPEWYSRVFPKKPVPQGVLDAVGKVTTPATTTGGAAAAGAGVRLPAIDMSKFNPGDYNYDGLLMSMRTIMLAQKHLLDEAMASGDKAMRNQATENLQQTVEALRRLEKDSGKILEQQGLTLRSADVRAAIVEAHQFIPARFKAVLKKLVRGLPNLAMTDQEMDEWAENAVNEACAGLKKTDLITAIKAA